MRSRSSTIFVQCTFGRPGTIVELGRISGVGATKLARYGDIFLDGLRPYA
jgi:hypothetical protein